MTKFRSVNPNGGEAASATPSVDDLDMNQEHPNPIERATEALNERDAVRHRLARDTVKIGFQEETFEADLINMSGGGALIESAIRPQLWDRVDLYLGEGNAIECAVRWLRNGRIGLEFAHETRLECPPEESDALLREVIRRSFPDTVAVASTAPEFDAARRGDRRHPLIWNGIIRWQGESRTVRLRNISTSGVLIDTQIVFPEDTELLLDLGKSGQYVATVGWSRGGQAGLVFAAPFDLSALAAKRPEVAAPRWKRPAHLERCADQPSPWADEWRRRNLSDLSGDLAG